MPPAHAQRFIRTVFFAAILVWGAWIYILVHLPPDNLSHYVFFLASLFFALTTALTMIFYKFAYHSLQVHHSLVNPRNIIQNCFRRAGIVSGVVTTAASLRMLGAFSAFNFFLLILAAFFIEVYFMQKH